MAEGCAQLRAARGHLADRQSAGNPPARRWNKRVRPIAMGVPPGSTEGSAHHQFPVRAMAVSGWPMSDPGVAFLRVHRDEIAEAEVEVHEGWRGLVLLRRIMASDAGWRRGFHSADDGTW